jgi:hypothetical protein
MIDTVRKLMARLEQEAVQFESMGESDMACGVYASLRVIRDELDGHAAIGNADSHRIEPLTRQNARLMAVLSKQAGLNDEFYQFRQQCVLQTHDYQHFVKRRGEVQAKISRLPRCPACQGRGETKPLFYVYECNECEGSGVAIDHGAALITDQQALLQLEFELIEHLVSALFTHGLPVSEQRALSVAQFYADSRSNLRCD